MCRNSGLICQGRLGLLKNPRRAAGKPSPRHFVLNGDTLSYWSCEQDFANGEVPRGKLPLRRAQITELSNENMFLMLAWEEKCLGLCALEKGDADQWIQAFRGRTAPLRPSRLATRAPTLLEDGLGRGDGQKERGDCRSGLKRASSLPAATQDGTTPLCEGYFLVCDPASPASRSLERLALFEDRLERYVVDVESASGHRRIAVVSLAHVQDVDLLAGGFALRCSARAGGGTLQLEASDGTDLKTWSSSLCHILDPLTTQLKSIDAVDASDDQAELQLEDDDVPGTPPSPQWGDQQQLIHQGTLLLRSLGHDLAHYFVMYKGHLEYFADPAGASLGLCLGRISGADVEAVRVNDDGFVFCMGTKCLEIVLPQTEDMDMWLYALRCCFSGGEQRAAPTPTDEASEMSPLSERTCEDLLPDPRELHYNPLAPIPERALLGSCKSAVEGMVKIPIDGRAVDRFCCLRRGRIECWMHRSCAAKGLAPVASISLEDFSSLQALRTGLILKRRYGGRSLAMHIGDASAVEAWRDEIMAVFANRTFSRIQKLKS